MGPALRAVDSYIIHCSLLWFNFTANNNGHLAPIKESLWADSSILERLLRVDYDLLLHGNNQGNPLRL